MFKLFFLNLVDVSSLEINFVLVKKGKAYPKLNSGTVRMYHNILKSRKEKRNGRGK